jgi:hypothetical protein
MVVTKVLNSAFKGMKETNKSEMKDLADSEADLEGYGD